MDTVDSATWRKSTKSGTNGNCVEAGVARSGRVLVRDTADRDAHTLSIPAEAWRRFTARLK